MKRIISLVLALVLLMCFLPGFASAEELDIETDGTLYEGYEKEVYVHAWQSPQYIFDFYPDYTGYYHFGHNSDKTVVMGTAGSDGYYLGNFYFDAVDGYTLWLEAGEHYYVTVSMYNSNISDLFDIYVDYLPSKESGWTHHRGRDFYWVDGLLAYGWIQSEGKWYCVNEMGYIYKDTMLIDGDGNKFILDSDGAMMTGWIEFENRTYYAGINGILYTGWKIIDGKWYCFHPTDAFWYHSCRVKVEGVYYQFDENGQYITGFYEDFYYDPNGAQVFSDWRLVDGKWYYFGENGYMHRSGLSYIDGQNYYFAEDGAMQIGWVNAYGGWLYCRSNGTLPQGWELVDGLWYYFDGIFMQSGWYKVDGQWYYLNNHMMTGWQQIDGLWYYLGDNGAMQTGWLNDNGKWYYLDSAMQTGLQEIDGKTYYLNTEMKVGWQQIDGKWYYFANDMRFGWQFIGGIWYYLGDDGAMVTGSCEIDGIVYNFADNGAWIP